MDSHRDCKCVTPCCKSCSMIACSNFFWWMAQHLTIAFLKDIVCQFAYSTVVLLLPSEMLYVIMGRQHSSLPILFTRALVFLLMNDQNMCAPKMLSLPLTMNKGCQNSASSLYIFCEYSHLHAYNVLHDDPCHIPKPACCQKPLLKALLMSLVCPRTGTRGLMCQTIMPVERQQTIATHAFVHRPTTVSKPITCRTHHTQEAIKPRSCNAHTCKGAIKLCQASRAGAQAAESSDVLGFGSATIGHLDSILDVVLYVGESRLHWLPVVLIGPIRVSAVQSVANGCICSACSNASHQ